jgi:hypothetical protein
MNLTTLPKTMSSREIAELTGKRHDHVLRDIETMLSELGDTSPQIWGDLPDSYGRPQRVAHLLKRECLILVSGYSVVIRAKIIDRWQGLETKAEALPVVSQAPEVVALQPALTSARMSSEILKLDGSALLGMVHKAHELAGAGHLLPMLPVYAVDAPRNEEGALLQQEAASSEPSSSLTDLLKNLLRRYVRNQGESGSVGSRVAGEPDPPQQLDTWCGSQLLGGHRQG